MVRLSNGVSFEFVAASGSLGLDGRGWRLRDFPKKYWPSCLKYLYSHPSAFFLPLELEIHKKELVNFVRIIKTIGYNAVEGNPDAIYVERNFVVNAMALFNPGIREWKRIYLPKIIANPDLKIILSITAENLTQLNYLLTEIIEIKSRNIVGLEFNPWCPNIPDREKEKIWSPQKIRRACELIKEKISLPLGLKVGSHQDYLSSARLTEGLVEWLSFNAVRWEKVFPNKESPLQKKFGVSGAVSGKKIQSLNQRMGLRIRSSGVKTQMLASSVGWGANFKEAYQDFLKIMRKNEGWEWADGVSFGSIFHSHPLWPPRMILRYQKEKEEKKIPETGAWWLRE